MQREKIMRVAIVTLGCDKNTVDSEYIAGLFEAAGHEVCTPENASHFDALLINTCCFITPAKEESINAILSWAVEKGRRRKTGKPFRLYVVGCLAERYARDLVSTIPEIDGIAGVGRWREIVRMVEEGGTGGRVPIVVSSGLPEVKITRSMPRRKLDAFPYAFLKIADGCSHTCAFCAIPRIKGAYRSVPRRILLSEVERLVSRGAREINLVAQDINDYGSDLGEPDALVRLVKDIVRIPGRFWVRLLYFYPRPLTEGLIRLMCEEEKVCPYIDIPLQHFSPRILERMGRLHESRRILEMLEEWRTRIPDVTLRTTFIVGYPGETRVDFEYLLQKVKEFEFDRVGVFIYSPEEDTPAAGEKPQVPHVTAVRRLDRLMRVQAEISLEKNRRLIGSVRDVLIEEAFPEEGVYIARSKADAPEVDGVTCVSSASPLKVGTFIRVKITDAGTYDLSGEPA